MNCTEVLELAPLYVTGELDAVRAESFSAHLRTCPSCARELEQQQAFDSRLRASVLAEPVDTFRIESNVRQSIAGKWRRWAFAAAGIAAVAAALLRAGLAVHPPPAPKTTPLYEAAALDHRLEIVEEHTRKWLTERADIEGLAESREIPAAALDAFAPAGYRLLKGKLCRLDGHLYLHLVFAGESGNFSVFLSHTEGNRRLHTEAEGQENVAAFKKHQLSALVVTDLPGDAAASFARTAAAIL